MSGHGWTLAYTRFVVSWVHRLTCLALTLALSGSPAVLAACMAVCGASPRSEALPTAGSEVDHSAHPSASTAATAPAHAHHGASGASHSTASQSTSPASHDASQAILTSRCSSCCDDEPVILSAGYRTETSAAQGVTPGHAVPVAPFRLTTRSAGGASPPSPRVSPPLPVRAPLALRI